MNGYVKGIRFDPVRRRNSEGNTLLVGDVFLGAESDYDLMSVASERKLATKCTQQLVASENAQSVDFYAPTSVTLQEPAQLAEPKSKSRGDEPDTPPAPEASGAKSVFASAGLKGFNNSRSSQINDFLDRVFRSYGYRSKVKLTKLQTLSLLEVVGDHAAAEDDWLQACHWLGDYKVKPRIRKSQVRFSRERITSLTLCSFYLFVLLPWHGKCMQSFLESFMQPTSAAPVLTATLTREQPSSIPVFVRHWSSASDAARDAIKLEYRMNESGRISGIRLAGPSDVVPDQFASIKTSRHLSGPHYLRASSPQSVEVQFIFGQESAAR